MIPILWRAQEQAGGWVSEAAIRVVAEMLGMAYIRVLEVATFYTQFQLQPVGRKAHVQVCGTTPCVLRGSDELFEVCRHRIHHDPFHVSADGDFSWEEVECLGACVNAPMVLIGNDTYEDLTKESFDKVLDGFASGKPAEAGTAERPPVLGADRRHHHAEVEAAHRSAATSLRSEPAPCADAAAPDAGAQAASTQDTAGAEAERPAGDADARRRRARVFRSDRPSAGRRTDGQDVMTEVAMSNEKLRYVILYTAGDRAARVRHQPRAARRDRCSRR